jgi:UV DNA damage endonuclease
MLARLGFVASVLSENISTSSTCRLKNATRPRLRELIAANLDALCRVTDFLERHRILLYRISSNVIPFASHPINELKWWEDFAPELEKFGHRVRALGVRVSTHPGQYTVLNSRTPAIVTAAIAELEYHARLLDTIGADTSAKIVVHIGGLHAGTESEAIERFCTVASQLSAAVLRRLVVENDDRLFDAEEVLSAAHRLRVPVVFDWLHHKANPCRAPLSDVLPAIFATWKPEDGRPKLHLSSQAADGPPGAHARYVRAADALAVFAICPDAPFDCMLEAKEKDRALLKLRADLQRKGIVESDLAAPVSSRPPAR